MCFWALSFAYAAYGNIPWIVAISYGLKPAVMAIVAFAVIRIGRRAVTNPIMWSEQLRGNRKPTAALSAVTAAIVGVILNLAVRFGWPPAQTARVDLIRFDFTLRSRQRAGF